MNVLVTGGAGFIGSNLTNRLIQQGENVIVFDDLSRRGTEKNLQWLRRKFDPAFRFVQGNIRNYELITQVCRHVDIIYHLAAQVAVTTSVIEPREDFDINALGTLNLLEACRKANNDPIVIFTSTNKVYGRMHDVRVIENEKRYQYRDLTNGVSEQRPLDLHTPYGCSKGAADQYVRDYYRIYGLKTVVFRMSCIYGPRQFGNEDQGWMAHFLISSLLGRSITIYGDGKQVRDILYVGDLIRAFQLAVDKIDAVSGKIFNIGGGAENTVSLLELIHIIQNNLIKKKIKYSFSGWRPGDQPVYISDIKKAKEELGWAPQIDKMEGIRRLFAWAQDNYELFSDLM